MKLLFLFFFSISYNNCISQVSDDDYTLVNAVIKQLTDFKKINSISVDEKSELYNPGNKFFSKDVFEEYLYMPFSKREKAKLKTLIKNLDFNFLSQQNIAKVEWDFRRLKNATKNVKKNDLIYDYKTWTIATPIYSRSKDFAFVHFYNHGGMIYVYKKISNKWKLYLRMPGELE